MVKRLVTIIFVLLLMMVNLIPSVVSASEKYAESADYGGVINSVVNDDTYVYAGGDVTKTVVKYLKTDMSVVATSPDYGGIINVIREDGNYIYVGGQTTKKIRRYLKTDMSFIDESADFGGQILGIYIDGTYVYICGETNKKVRRLLKTDLSTVDESADLGVTNYCIVGDSTHLYVSNNAYRIYKLNITTLANLGSTPSYGGFIYQLDMDNTYLYTAGDDIKTIRRYLKSDLSYVSESPSYGNNVRAITIDDTYVYIGGTNPYDIKKYLKSDLSYIGATPTYGDIIKSISVDNDFVYCGGQVIDKVFKYGVSSPTVQNNGIDELSQDSVVINGEVLTYDTTWELNTTVIVYWGTTNGGTNPLAWDFSSAPLSPTQPQVVADFILGIDNLEPNTLYFYNTSVNNGTIYGWGTVGTFTTKRQGYNIMNTILLLIIAIGTVLIVLFKCDNPKQMLAAGLIGAITIMILRIIMGIM